MRITGGILRGRKISMPGGVIRPAMDRMRESVFASLGDLSGLSFLDLFSGSGIIALEAASRGATYIEAVETDKIKADTLLKNVEISPVRIQCRFMSVELYIRRVKRNFDIIFCDPPFPYRYRRQLVADIVTSGLLNASGKLLLHRPREDKIETLPAGLEIAQSREFGRSIVDCFHFV